jgi:hypothetical protein
VIVERQELEPSGKWSAATTVNPLSISTLRPFPAETADPTDKAVYNQWATQNVVEILRPPFYQYVQGDHWGFAEQKAPVVAAAAFDPAQHVADKPEDLMKLTPEQRRAVAAYRIQQNRQNRAGRGPAQPGGGRRGATPPEDIIMPQVFDPDRASFQVAEDVRLMLPEPALPPSHPMNRAVAIQLGILNESGGMNPDAAANPEQAALGVGMAPGVTAPTPPGQFQPGKWVTDNPQNPNIVGWFTDDSVIPGHKYRYRVTYLVKSPLFFMQQLVKDPKLAEVFALKSEPSEWSATVEVSSTINYWMLTQRSNTATIQVFRMVGGQPKTKTFEVSPGDRIGAKVGDVDFDTGCTLVDIRMDMRSNGEPYILLLNPEGQIIRRDLSTDSKDPRFQQLKQQATSVAAR